MYYNKNVIQSLMEKLNLDKCQKKEKKDNLKNKLKKMKQY